MAASVRAADNALPRVCRWHTGGGAGARPERRSRRPCVRVCVCADDRAVRASGGAHYGAWQVFEVRTVSRFAARDRRPSALSPIAKRPDRTATHQNNKNGPRTRHLNTNHDANATHHGAAECKGGTSAEAGHSSHRVRGPLRRRPEQAPAASRAQRRRCGADRIDRRLQPQGGFDTAHGLQPDVDREVDLQQAGRQQAREKPAAARARLDARDLKPRALLSREAQ